MTRTPLYRAGVHIKIDASTYRRRILEKMALTSTAEIVRYAVENQLVE
ncbi:MAG: hypothetical protein GY953_52535 [bacterium]|nr:hypothetical protein [bacterium]